ncbi:BMC domain-containing protein [Pantoea sp. BRR-3P]|uniref:BMC domain-containing protein n=1 Tax=Pantoea sp. BRR-3P TaxID=3141541 RepID=UPI0031F56ED9
MKSLGIIETIGLAAAIKAADAACKAADVQCIGYRTVGSGRVNICFEGEISAIRAAIEHGTGVIEKKQLLASLVIARPERSVITALQKLKGKGFCQQNAPSAFKAPAMPEVMDSQMSREEKASVKKGNKS